ncbi:Lrp/AsnC family transcriptional regulator [Microbacterium sp. ZW T5_45]|uniref:Lrp/AsnC family transcriptional regulator n=1 Tax=Microbacterium sp. ZW T5_45 TaxID=3378080 RepID=UPI0038545276
MQTRPPQMTPLQTTPQQTTPLDTVDRRLLHALQIDPRASWSDLAPVVGVDAATLGRRWERLRASGTAWATGYRRHGQGALVEIECSPSHLQATAAALSRDDRLIVLDDTSGGRDLLTTLFVPDLASVSEYVVEGLGAIEGVRSVRTHVVNEVLTDGGAWRLRDLTAAETARIPRPRPPRPRAARTVPVEVRTAIERELWRDARTPISEIATRYDIAAQRISDGIATLRASGELLLRTDVARAYSGWPVYAWYFVEAPARTIDAARTAIAKVPEVRLAVASSSRFNLILAVWLRSLPDVNRFEIALEAALPGARIADRSVVLRIRKPMNQLIGPDTRSLGPAN